MMRLRSCVKRAYDRKGLTLTQMLVAPMLTMKLVPAMLCKWQAKMLRMKQTVTVMQVVDSES